MQLHVFAGSFANRDAACQYTEAQWEPEPTSSASDEEYAAWEARNPQWQMEADLSVYLDSDFIETIDGETRYEYLSGLLANPADVDTVRNTAGTSNILVLIFPNALDDPPASFSSTPSLTYCGSFSLQS